jgi:hypothetical protein
MEPSTIVLFGEAEKGEYRTAYFCENLPQLVEYFGHPPAESRGLHYAVQSLLYRRNLVFFRVAEEGFSEQDYLDGLDLLQYQRAIPNIMAIGLPGVGDSRIIHATITICKIFHSILITNEADLYDYLSHK